jgi:hypothetical protein
MSQNVLNYESTSPKPEPIAAVVACVITFVVAVIGFAILAKMQEPPFRLYSLLRLLHLIGIICGLTAFVRTNSRLLTAFACAGALGNAEALFLYYLPIILMFF